MGKNTREHWEQRFQNEEDSDRWSSAFRMRFYDWAVNHISPREENVSVLDVGSALGHGLQHVCQSHPSWHPVGIDFASTAAQQAVIPTHQIDLRGDDIPGVYDYVLCIQTLEHFSDPVPVLKKLLAAARRQLIITVPYDEDISKHDEHEFSFTREFFERFGPMWCEIDRRNYPRIKIVYELRRPRQWRVFWYHTRERLGRLRRRI